MDVGPEGFAMAKMAETGRAGNGAFGMVETVEGREGSGTGEQSRDMPNVDKVETSCACRGSGRITFLTALQQSQTVPRMFSARVCAGAIR